MPILGTVRNPKHHARSKKTVIKDQLSSYLHEMMVFDKSIEKKVYSLCVWVGTMQLMTADGFLFILKIAVKLESVMVTQLGIALDVNYNLRIKKKSGKITNA